MMQWSYDTLLKWGTDELTAHDVENAALDAWYLLEHIYGISRVDFLMPFLTSGNILGIDICGECQQGIPLPQYLEAEKINGETNKELFDFLMHYCRNF